MRLTMVLPSETLPRPAAPKGSCRVRHDVPRLSHVQLEHTGACMVCAPSSHCNTRLTAWPQSTTACLAADA